MGDTEKIVLKMYRMKFSKNKFKINLSGKERKKKKSIETNYINLETQ